jgi:REP element-mobilizing transposase RayT
MAHSLSKILLHIVFSTKNWTKLILSEFENELHAYLASICRANKSIAYKVGGTENHVHIACSLPRTLAVSSLLEEIKSSSSKWMKSKSPRCSLFTWQAEYGVFSLGQSQLPTLIQYIENQHKHHNQLSYEEEVLDLLKLYDVECDEQYLWE